MVTFIQKALKSTQRYTIMDYAFLKIALLSVGILLGAYFADFFLNYTTLIWGIYLASFLWILYKTFFKY
ncbi:MAG TPA: hypothetical protein DIT32_07230 [Peptococcaceae bacterium]|nr:hypothetical protein [Peptococcaceae bacterium]